MLNIRELFRQNRFPSGWKFIPVFIYLPIGVALAVIRVFIGVHALIAASLLYKLSSVRSVVLRIMCSILGIFVFKENESVEDESVKVIVSNHVSLLDHLAIYLLKNSVSVNVKELPSFFHCALNYKDLGSYRNQENLIQNVKHLINNDMVIDVQPEMGMTSGQKGLLRFSSWPCKLLHPIQPVAIKVWRPPLMDIAPTVINSSWSSDIFWFLFVPFTVFTIKFIPVVRPKENETPEETTKRLEQLIAKELNISATNFTVEDKVELEKRLSSEKTVVRQPSAQARIDQATIDMASRVKEVLPDVPFDVICKDIAKTRNIDLTIANFLEGLVKYTPEKIPQTGGTFAAGDKRKSSLNVALPSTSFDTSSRTFHKSAQERMISFQERKLRLIQSARQKYMEKHALNLMNSS